MTTFAEGSETGAELMPLRDWCKTGCKSRAVSGSEYCTECEGLLRAAKIAHHPVNHPAHYTQGGIECIDAIAAALGHDGFLAYCRGNAIKYLWRTGKKANHAEDLRKAAWYATRAADHLEASNG